MMFEKNSLWVAAGDSITEAGRNVNAKVWDSDRLGGGYVYFVNAALTAFCPELEIRVENRGVGGDTSAQVLERWHDNVLSLKPDYLSLMVGVNDVWRHFDGFASPVDFISLDKYVENCRCMVRSALPVVKKMWLMSPFMFSRNMDDPMFRMVREFAAAFADVAREFDVPFIDLQSAVDKVLLHRHSCVFSADMVHPNAAGHMLLAGEIWKFLTQV